MALPPTSQRALSQGWARATLFFIVYIVLAMVADSIALSCYNQLHGTTATIADLTDDTGLTQVVDQYLLVIHALLCIAAAFLCWKYIDRMRLADMGFHRSSLQRDSMNGLLLGAGLVVIGAGILYCFGAITWSLSPHGMNKEVLVWIGLLVLSAFKEEIVFRGYILDNLLESMNRWIALVISAIVFVVLHMRNDDIHLLGMINLFIAGCLLGLSYIHTHNLWFPVCFHIGWNVLQGPVLGFPVSGIPIHSVTTVAFNSKQTWLTGGHFGFEGSVIATLVLLAGLLYCLKRKA